MLAFIMPPRLVMKSRLRIEMRSKVLATIVNTLCPSPSKIVDGVWYRELLGMVLSFTVNRFWRARPPVVF